jgi:pSer/pThr/pTyr-binding forkhead associated (FHA) protein
MTNKDKKELLNKVIPKAALKALTETSKHSIKKRMEGEDVILIFKYPFKIGREARVKQVDGEIIIQERHKLGGVKPNNDTYLLDNGELLQISREHCSIEKENNKYILKDRNSACGCMVNETKIGINNENSNISCILKDGDIITLGSEKSQYKYKFILFDAE